MWSYKSSGLYTIYCHHRIIHKRKHFFNLRFLHIKEEIDVGVNHWSAYVDRGNYREKYQIKPRSEEEPPSFGKNPHVDTHPNAAGHKNIADQLWEYYETNFL